MSEKSSDSRPLSKSYFWTHGIVPMAVGMVMMFFPVFVPPPPGTDGLTILLAAIPLFYGAVEIRHFRRKKARGEVQ